MVWMANHPHLLVRAFDADALKCFYMELQKKITDCMKCLLGFEQLNLWEGEPEVAIVLDVDKAIQRIVYYYLNPSQANLVDTISEYPLLNTWLEFSSSPGDLDAALTSLTPWIQQPTIKKLRSRRLTAPEDAYITQQLIEKATRQHDLIIRPNDWMKAFNITSNEEVKRINDQIIAAVTAGEAQFAADRARKGYVALGAKRLRKQEILKPHKPKKKSRRIFVLGSTKEIRIPYIQKIKEIFTECSRLYRLASKGHLVTWPPGVFPPSIPPLANALT